MAERTLILIKPDGVQRALVGTHRRALRAARSAHRRDEDAQPTARLAEQHYDVHREKPFFAGLIEFITSAPLVAMAVEGPNAIAVCREINGATRPRRQRQARSAATWRSTPVTTWCTAPIRPRTQPPS